jgi:hypothetical protein
LVLAFFDEGLDLIQLVEEEALMDGILRKACIAERLKGAFAAMEKAHDIA